MVRLTSETQHGATPTSFGIWPLPEVQQKTTTGRQSRQQPQRHNVRAHPQRKHTLSEDAMASSASLSSLNTRHSPSNASVTWSPDTWQHHPRYQDNTCSTAQSPRSRKYDYFGFRQYRESPLPLLGRVSTSCLGSNCAYSACAKSSCVASKKEFPNLQQQQLLILTLAQHRSLASGHRPDTYRARRKIEGGHQRPSPKQISDIAPTPSVGDKAQNIHDNRLEKQNWKRSKPRQTIINRYQPEHRTKPNQGKPEREAQQRLLRADRITKQQKIR